MPSSRDDNVLKEDCLKNQLQVVLKRTNSSQRSPLSPHNARVKLRTRNQSFESDDDDGAVSPIIEKKEEPSRSVLFF